MTQPFYFDTDMGIDDAMALAYLLADPTADLVGVGTVSGNVDAERAAQNVLDLLALAGRPGIPVAIGALDPQAGVFDGGVPLIHGANGVGDVSLPPSSEQPFPSTAVELLLALSHRYAGSLRLITIGPLTNLAAALDIDPSLSERIADVTIMGGAALAPGNLSPVAEANVGNDPEAAADVLAAPWPITLVPLDVTLENVLEESGRQTLLDSGRPVARAIGQMLDLYFDFYVATYGRRCSALHDPLAVGIALGHVVPELAPVVDVVVDATAGPGRGQTICELRGSRRGFPEQPGAHVRVVLQTGTDFAAHLVERIATL
jgi:purine nucleosidase